MEFGGSASGDFPKSGVFWGSPQNKTYRMLGSMLASTYSRKLPSCSEEMSRASFQTSIRVDVHGLSLVPVTNLGPEGLIRRNGKWKLPFHFGNESWLKMQ